MGQMDQRNQDAITLQRETVGLIYRTTAITRARTAFIRIYLGFAEMSNHLDAAQATLRAAIWHDLARLALRQLMRALDAQEMDLHREMRRRWSEIDTDKLPVVDLFAGLGDEQERDA